MSDNFNNATHKKPPHPKLHQAIKDIFTLLDKRQMTMREAARQAGYAEYTLYGIRVSGRSCNLSTLEAFADLLGYDVMLVRKDMARSVRTVAGALADGEPRG